MSNNTFAKNDTIPIRKDKHYFSVEFGGHRSLIIGNRYIIPDTNSNLTDVAGPSSRFWGFTEKNTTGFQLNFLYNLIISNKFQCEAGISLFSRPLKYESDSATLTKIHSQYPVNKEYCYTCTSDSGVIKYFFNEINWELPLYLSFYSNKIKLSIGPRFYIASLVQEKHWYIDRSEKMRPKIYFNIFDSMFLDMKFHKYLNNNRRWAIYTGLSMNIPWYYYYVQIGINYSIGKNNK